MATYHSLNYVDQMEKREPGVVRVLVSIPTIGAIHVESYCNRLQNFMHFGKLEERGRFQQSNPRFQFYFSIIGKLFTPMAREEAAKQCLKWDCDYLLMIDDDMMCPDDMFEKLFSHNVDIIAPLAFTRNAPHKPVIYSSMEGYDTVQKKDWFLNTTVQRYPKDQLVECDAVGFGAALIKKEVFEKTPQPWFMSTCGTGEDILFCYNAKKAGCRVFVDTSVKLGHLGHPTNITEEYVEEYRKKEMPDFEKKFAEYKKYQEPVLIQGERYV